MSYKNKNKKKLNINENNCLRNIEEINKQLTNHEDEYKIKNVLYEAYLKELTILRN
ncbi:hypothetical protein PGB90_003808 [Kerria lacca]